MNVRATVCRAVVLTTIGAVAVAGCAGMRSGGMSTDAAVAERQQLMKRQGAALREISGKLKAGSIQAIAADAEVLVETSKRIPALFPPNSTSPTSRAKPEIWQRRAEFDKYAQVLNTEATRLRDAARASNAANAQAAFGSAAKNACTACHDAFRGPEIKK
jgi:cytochrome c556